MKVAIIGTGNIGTDLMYKILRSSGNLELAGMVGIDPESDGLQRARGLGLQVTSDGAAGLESFDDADSIELLFDATSARAHVANWELMEPTGRRMVDLTPAAIGPFVVPTVNVGGQIEERNVNMVTCGGQATVPIVAAVNAVSNVEYAEIVASIASRSAGPGTRANIDEFTETTARALEVVGGAKTGKAIIILNPAEPPLIMRDTVMCLVRDGDERAIERSVEEMVASVAEYVPGYRLKQQVQFERFDEESPVRAPTIGFHGSGLLVSVFLEVEGAADYLPPYAGNLDIMTSAALRTGELIAESKGAVRL